MVHPNFDLCINQLNVTLTHSLLISNYSRTKLADMWWCEAGVALGVSLARFILGVKVVTSNDRYIWHLPMDLSYKCVQNTSIYNFKFKHDDWRLESLFVYSPAR